MKRDYRKQIRGSLMLLLAAIIWGSAFVAQSEGMEYVGPFTFASVRFFIGSFILLPVISFIKKKETGNGNLLEGYDKSTGIKGFFAKHKILIIGGFFCGLALTAGTNFQQWGIKYVSSVGKAGFITTLYIILVPVFSLFIGKKVRPIIWIALAFAVSGLYFLCVTEKLTFELLDILLILCAVFFAVQIMVVDHYVDKVNPVALSSFQFLIVGIISGICMFIFEKPTISGIMAAMGPILYAGVLSSGVAFTLQVVAQKDLDPTLASMIMCLESVVSVLSGFLFLGQRLSVREGIGCVLMFVGVILAQLPEKVKE
ncbi:MAG: DMT family transporter [Lachnospiraceae bacterium]|nr:DMT family transporter [Lachnospiraceae bacterium]